MIENKAFPDIQHQQAYTLLSYAHIILFLCQELQISIVEAHCKDDIDRGNAFKAILKGHFHYLTGKITDPWQLEKILIQTLIAPVIVKRQGVIASREPFIHSVYARILEAHRRRPNPQLPQPYVGTYLVHRPTDTVQNQDLFPLGHTAKTGSEYIDFLAHLKLEPKWQLPGFDGNLVNDIASGSRFSERSGITQQVKRDLHGFPMYLDGELLRGQPVDEAFAKIVPYLQGKGLSERKSWKVMCSFNQALTDAMFLRLEAVFCNTDLQVSFVPDNQEMTANRDAGVHLDADNGIASLRFVLFAKIINDDGSQIERVKATCTIPDHTSGVANFEFSFFQA